MSSNAALQSKFVGQGTTKMGVRDEACLLHASRYRACSSGPAPRRRHSAWALWAGCATRRLAAWKAKRRGARASWTASRCCVMVACLPQLGCLQPWSISATCGSGAAHGSLPMWPCRGICAGLAAAQGVAGLAHRPLRHQSRGAWPWGIIIQQLRGQEMSARGPAGFVSHSPCVTPLASRGTRNT
jgi:hypothetical protein